MYELNLITERENKQISTSTKLTYKEKLDRVKLPERDIREMNEKFEKMKRKNLESMQKRIDKIESTMAKSVRVNTPKLLERIN